MHGEVLPTLQAVQDAVDGGLHAAGFLAYEAAPGLDKACHTHLLQDVPLVWFGLFRQPEDIELPAAPPPNRLHLGEWKSSVSIEEYTHAIARIKDYLKSGDTYQVNYTFRLRAPFRGDAWRFFLRLHSTQRARYSSFIDAERFCLCCASPELFFALDGNDLVSRPMKGTSRRGLTFEQDRDLAQDLRHSEKNRAENVMIVDMVRNDMGRIADAGSVSVPRLFDIERYPTVLQMTSTVACTTSASFPDIAESLFPCASITGAPKIRTMEIIKELERDPRGVYTGCIGQLSPGRRGQFNVAIRTVWIDKQAAVAEYGVGGGIVWDSDAGSEFAECRVKGAILTTEAPKFELLESILWEPGKGFFLLGRHLERLVHSAEYFGFRADTARIENRLMKDASSKERSAISPGPGSQGRHEVEGQVAPLEACGARPVRGWKVRLRVAQNGRVSVEWIRLPHMPSSRAWTVSPANSPIDLQNPFLYHKTTNRRVYERARLSCPELDDVLLWNKHGEITESTVANIVLKKGGKLVTPPVACGLLPGIFRQWLLDHGTIREEVLRVEDVFEAEKVFLVNSVRRWIPAAIRRAANPSPTELNGQSAVT